MPYLSCKKIENDVYNFPTWQYCKYKDIFDSRIIINSTAKFYISISYQKDLLSIDTRIFTPSRKDNRMTRLRAAEWFLWFFSFLYVFHCPKSTGCTERCYQFVITSLLSIKDSRNILISVDHSINLYIFFSYFVNNHIIFPYRIFIICPKADSL